ncbi:MAG: twin-arginine translocase subunit TatC [Acidobacteria bacterium]|nr:MAG: twin-arginine translocase subunit TatC [Acidobacteriota bacterium]
MALVPFRSARQAAPDPPEDSDGWPDDDATGAGARMTFLEHLDELRKRLVIGVSAIGVGCALAFTFVNTIYAFVMHPLSALLPKGSHFIFTEPMEAFLLKMKMALIVGIMMAMPVTLWQVWLFIAPGLYAREKKLAIPFVVLASFGFVGGAAFSHYVLFPWMWQFFASFADDELTFLPKIAPVFSLYMKMLLGMGLVFQMPALVYPLARMGLVTARFLVRHFKYAVLIIFIAAAVITPSGDPMTQTLMAAPMVALYLISIVIAFIFGKKKARTAEPADATAD